MHVSLNEPLPDSSGTPADQSVPSSSSPTQFLLNYLILSSLAYRYLFLQLDLFTFCASFCIFASLQEQMLELVNTHSIWN